MSKSITEEIAELRAMPTNKLVDRYRALFGHPPRVKHREHLWKRCAWKVQEQRFGGLSEVAKRRLDELIAEIRLPIEETQRTVTGRLRANGRSSKAGTTPVGSTLTRQWRGEEVRVQVVEGGFEHEGVVHRSLSAVAKAVTGSHCSGPAWFGLAPRRKGAG